jgi:hypothetical protein
LAATRDDDIDGDYGSGFVVYLENVVENSDIDKTEMTLEKDFEGIGGEDDFVFFALRFWDGIVGDAENCAGGETGDFGEDDGVEILLGEMLEEFGGDHPVEIFVLERKGREEDVSDFSGDFRKERLHLLDGERGDIDSGNVVSGLLEFGCEDSDATADVEDALLGSDGF